MTTRTPYENQLALSLERAFGPDWWQSFLSPHDAVAIATAPEGLGRQRAIVNVENRIIALVHRTLGAAVDAGLVVPAHEA